MSDNRSPWEYLCRFIYFSRSCNFCLSPKSSKTYRSAAAELCVMLPAAALGSQTVRFKDRYPAWSERGRQGRKEGREEKGGRCHGSRCIIKNIPLRPRSFCFKASCDDVLNSCHIWKPCNKLWGSSDNNLSPMGELIRFRSVYIVRLWSILFRNGDTMQGS